MFQKDKRITTKEALNHPFFESIRDAAFETEPDFKLNFDFEDENVSLETLKDYIYKEMLSMHAELPQGCYFPYPILPSKNLMTLDLDGSLIYIGNYIVDFD